MDEQNKREGILPPAHPRPVTDFLFPLEGRQAESADNELLEAIARGDQKAFAILVRRYLPKMIMLAQRIVFDREQALEIAQESFLRVWTHAAKWDPDGTATFLTWLRRITVNLSISQNRRRREKVSIETVENVPDPQTDGFGAVAESHRKRLVQKALAQLPERQRAALALYYFGEVSHVEAASTMQMSAKAFDSLLVRARRNVKRYLADMGFTDNGDIA